MTQLSANLSDTDITEEVFAEPRLLDTRLGDARLTSIKPSEAGSSDTRLTETGLSENDLADLFGLPEEAGWQERALCAQTDPEAFFPEKGGSTREAKRICSGCEVRGECLEYALQHDERFGIWGGLSERERRKLKRRAV